MILAIDIERRIRTLAEISSDADNLTRLAFTPEMTAANDLVAGWMRDAGMSSEFDGAGNVFGRYESEPRGGRALLLGSHIDTVGNGGHYDGILGVVTAIGCVAEMHRRGRRFPFAIEVVGFGDEEGVRFGTTIAGSHAVAGRFDPRKLVYRDRDGVTARDALARCGLDEGRIASARRDDERYLAYVELHIEQGPALEAAGHPLGCVTSIAGASTFSVDVAGMAGHAGTVPMELRQDALAAAAACILAVEDICRRAGNVVGTVGSLAVAPGANNVIPGTVRFSIDVRSGQDESLRLAVAEIRSAFETVARQRRVEIIVEPLGHREVTPCAPCLIEDIAAAIQSVGATPCRLSSGAGHDGVAMSAITEIGMMFVRCRGGVSHHPGEHVSSADIEIAARALLAFIERFGSGS